MADKNKGFGIPSSNGWERRAAVEKADGWTAAQADRYRHHVRNACPSTSALPPKADETEGSTQSPYLTQLRRSDVVT